MANPRIIAVAGAVMLASTAAYAADMPMPEPAPEPVPLVEAAGGWYLRGDIGFSNQQVDDLDNALYHTGTIVNLDHVQKSFDAAPFGGVGVGYQFNQWFRMDLTGEYRGSANFHGLDTFTDTAGPTQGVDVYSARKYEITGLVNGYFDLGTWHNITPFIGAGVGVSRNTIADFTDQGQFLTGGVTTTSVAYGKDSSKVNFAWALMAGAGYEVAPGLTLEAAYRYINLGKAQSGDLIAFDGTNAVYNPMKFKDITSNDFKIGMRWALGGSTPAPAYADPPLMRKF
jgi:opacity protein-like surface antigen